MGAIGTTSDTTVGVGASAVTLAGVLTLPPRRRVVGAIDWLSAEAVVGDVPPRLREIPVGSFGGSTGAAAALIAAAERPDRVRAVVSRRGRPDPAGPVPPRV